MTQQVKPRKILIVEDDTVIREMMIEILSFEDYICQSTGNGLDALDILRGEESYLVFLDLLLPGMYGDAICKNLGANHSHIIVLMSAINNLVSLNEESSLHVNAILPKPFEEGDVFNIIKQYMK